MFYLHAAHRKQRWNSINSRRQPYLVVAVVREQEGPWVGMARRTGWGIGNSPPRLTR
jgi:hypothetical protein